jgi:hypothetical protein
MDYLWGALGLNDEAPPEAEGAGPGEAGHAGDASAQRGAPGGGHSASAGGAGAYAGAAGGEGLVGGDGEDDGADEAARRKKAASLSEARKAAWESEAAADFMPGADGGAGGSDLEASMRALQDALSLEGNAAFAPPPPPPPAAASSARQSPAAAAAAANAAALANATALLGPGAGGLLPSAGRGTSTGAEAWDEMEARMAALTAAIEGDGGASPVMDAAKLEARAARMREREAKRAIKRQAMGGDPITPAEAAVIAAVQAGNQARACGRGAGGGAARGARAEARAAQPRRGLPALQFACLGRAAPTAEALQAPHLTMCARLRRAADTLHSLFARSSSRSACSRLLLPLAPLAPAASRRRRRLLRLRRAS